MMTEQQVVIIGGSEGIGLAVATAARTLGARVLAVSRTKEKLEAARDAVSGLERWRLHQSSVCQDIGELFYDAKRPNPGSKDNLAAGAHARFIDGFRAEYH